MSENIKIIITQNNKREKSNKSPGRLRTEHVDNNKTTIIIFLCQLR